MPNVGAGPSKKEIGYMKLRKLAVALVAAPALVASVATPGTAGVDPGAIVIAGIVTITPTNAGVGNLKACFDNPLTTACTTSTPLPPWGAGASNGVAAGVDTVDVVDGLSVNVNYTETCVPPLDVALQGKANIEAEWHDLGHAGWGPGHPRIQVQWNRVGLVALIEGHNNPVKSPLYTAPPAGTPINDVVVGAAVFAPLGIPACNQPLQVAVVAAVAVVDANNP